MSSYNLQIMAMDRIVFEGEVTSLIAPGTAGQFGVLAHHAPLISDLREGTLVVKQADGNTVSYKLQGGLLEVGHNRAVVLADGKVETV